MELSTTEGKGVVWDTQVMCWEDGSNKPTQKGSQKERQRGKAKETEI